MALARGYAASIPIIIRSLANSIAFVPDEKYLPYRLDDSVLHTLDAGEHQQVRTYHLQWWSGPMRKDLENVEILGKLTMMKCLEHFNKKQSNGLTSRHRCRTLKSNIRPQHLNTRVQQKGMPILHTIPATLERCSPGRRQISNLCRHNVLYHPQSLECRNPQGFDIQPAPRGRHLERDRAYSGTGKGKGGSPDCRSPQESVIGSQTTSRTSCFILQVDMG